MSARLPIHEIESPLLEAFAESRRIVVKAPTGSGKSTQIPKMLLRAIERDSREILVLQPRRIAARMLAARVAAELGERLGETVGYQVRLDRVCGPRTRILFVTEGILLRRVLSNPELSDVAAVIFDEFHERHLHGDIGLARCLLLQRSCRPDLRLIVMSATLDDSSLMDYLSPARLIVGEGRSHPVGVEYLPRSTGGEDVWETAAKVVAERFGSSQGHTLIFMPGAYEIARTVAAVRARLPGGISVLPLHGELPPSEQDAAVATSETRKVIVATNVAETSLTIEGVTLVVDSGLARISRYDPRRSINTLFVERISLASAEQRAGRAGRTAPGTCVRLWTKYENAGRPAREEPEICRVDLAETALSLKAGGIQNLADFPWVTPPPPGALERALVLLTDLGALAPDGHITEMGMRMPAFPVHPRYARMFLAAAEEGCGRAAALAAALMQGRGLLTRCDRRTEEARIELFGGGDSDFGMLFRAFEYARKNDFRVDACRQYGVHAGVAREAARVYAGLLEVAGREGIPPGEERISDAIFAACLLAGFPDQVGTRISRGGHQYAMVHGRRGALPPESLASGADLLVAAEIHEIGNSGGEARVRLGMATRLDRSLLESVYPGAFERRRDVIYDSAMKRVVLRTATMYRDLAVEQSERDAPPGPEAAECLAREILAGNLRLDGWDDATDDFVARVNFLAKAMPELNLPPIDDAARELLIGQICEDAVCNRDIKNKPALSAVRAWLNPTQRAALEKYAPEKVALAGGRQAKVVYGTDGSVKVSARIQDLYGTCRIAPIAGGRVPPMVEILAPNFRPVQVTADLANFWKTTYPEISPALQRRYPKHIWKTPSEAAG